MISSIDCREIAVLAKSSSVTKFLQGFFCDRKRYIPNYFRNPNFFIKALDKKPPAAVIAECKLLNRVAESIKELPTVALIDGVNIESEIENAINCRARNYICKPYIEQDLEYKLESIIRDNDKIRKMETDVRDLEAIIDLTQWILATLDSKELLYRVVTKIADVMPVTRCSIIRVDWLHKSAYVVSSFEDPDIVGIKINLRKYPEISEALRLRKPVLVKDVLTDPLMKRVKDIIGPLGIRSILVVPIFLSDKVIGTLFIRTSRDGHTFNEHEVKLLKALADASAIVLHNALLFEQIEDEKTRLEKLAITDFLTGIYNIRYFYHRCIEEFSRSERYSLPMSCLMVDIDYFKKINDVHGHKIGDSVLREFAQKMRKHSRKSDVVARYGGEEFVILMPQTTAQGAMAEAERIRECVKKCHFKSLKKDQRLTVSIGISTYPHEKIHSHDDLISMADEALFAAKRKGRDRIAVAGK